MLGLIEVPQHRRAVFTARGAERSVRGDGDRIDVAGVADVVGLDPARGEFPDLITQEYVSGKDIRKRLSDSSALGFFHQCNGDWLSHGPKALK